MNTYFFVKVVGKMVGKESKVALGPYLDLESALSFALDHLPNLLVSLFGDIPRSYSATVDEMYAAGPQWSYLGTKFELMEEPSDP